MSIIPEPLRHQIEAAARMSPDMNISNNDDPVDDESAIIEEGRTASSEGQKETDSALVQGRIIEA